MALVENVQRKDLNPIDRAKGFERLMSEFGLTSSEVAVRIGKSVSYVSNSVRLLSLPDALKDGLLSGIISEGHARALAAIDDPDLMVQAYKTILKENGSVRRAEELARRIKAQINKEGESQTKNTMIVSEEIDKMQEAMLRAIRVAKHEEPNRKTIVKLVRTQRETRINLVFKGTVEDTEERLQKVYKALSSIKNSTE